MNDIENTIEYLKHCKDVGNIIFQIPEDNMTIDVILSTLEKQKGKTVEEDVAIKIGYNGYRYKRERPLCPSCNNVDLSIKQPYCNMCGQKLSWEVEE